MSRGLSQAGRFARRRGTTDDRALQKIAPIELVFYHERPSPPSRDAHMRAPRTRFARMLLLD